MLKQISGRLLNVGYDDIGRISLNIKIIFHPRANQNEEGEGDCVSPSQYNFQYDQERDIKNDSGDSDQYHDERKGEGDSNYEHVKKREDEFPLLLQDGITGGSYSDSVGEGEIEGGVDQRNNQIMREDYVSGVGNHKDNYKDSNINHTFNRNNSTASINKDYDWDDNVNGNNEERKVNNNINNDNNIINNITINTDKYERKNIEKSKLRERMQLKNRNKKYEKNDKNKLIAIINKKKMQLVKMIFDSMIFDGIYMDNDNNDNDNHFNHNGDNNESNSIYSCHSFNNSNSIKDNKHYSSNVNNNNTITNNTNDTYTNNTNNTSSSNLHAPQYVLSAYKVEGSWTSHATSSFSTSLSKSTNIINNDSNGNSNNNTNHQSNTKLSFLDLSVRNTRSPWSPLVLKNHESVVVELYVKSTGLVYASAVVAYAQVVESNNIDADGFLALNVDFDITNCYSSSSGGVLKCVMSVYMDDNVYDGQYISPYKSAVYWDSHRTAHWKKYPVTPIATGR